MRYIKYILGLVLIVIIASLVYNNKYKESISTKEVFNKASKFAMGIGTKQDKFARFTYETQQLVDPVTGKIPANIRLKELAFAKTLNNTNKNIEDLDWQSRGPWNVGGRTRAFEVDIDNENLIVAGSVSGGIWKSIDGGDNWYKVAMNDNSLSVTDIEQDTRDGHHNEWYYTSGELSGASQGEVGATYLGNGVYKSDDYGETWFPLSSTTNSTPQSWDGLWERTWDIEINTANTLNTELYVATYSTIYKSVNGGNSWTTSLTSPLSGDISFFTEIEISATGVMYAGMSSENEIIYFGLSPVGGVWRSTDGNNWVNLSDGFFPPQYNRIAIAINPQNENEIYTLVSNVSPGYGKETYTWVGDTVHNALYKYTYLTGDGTGADGEWVDLTENLFIGPEVFDDFNAQSGYDLMVRVKPDDENAVFVGGTNLYRSNDGFSSQQNVDIIGGYLPGAELPLVLSYQDHHPDQHGLWFSPSNPNVAYSYHDGGISRTNNIMADNVIWESKNNGYITSQFYTISIKNNDTSNLIIGGLQDNGTFLTQSKEPDAEWTSPWGGDGSFSAIPDHGDHIIVSLQSGRVYMLQLNAEGQTTAYERIDPALDRSEFSFIHPFEIDPNDNYSLFMPIGNQLYRKNDLANVAIQNTWDSTMVGWEIFPDTAFSIQDEEFTAITISKFLPNRLYLGTNRGNAYRIDDHTDLNSPLVDITSPDFPDDAYIKCIAVNPDNAFEIIVTFTNYLVYSVFYSVDGGTNFTKIAGNLEQFQTGQGNGPSVRWANILPTDTAIHYFVGTSIGLFHTSLIDGQNTSWQLMSPDKIGNNIVNMIKSRTIDDYIVVATHGNGIFSANTPDDEDTPIVSDINDENEVFEFNLYPNPASSLLNIEFDLINNSKVEICVYDELGRKTLLNRSYDNLSGNQKIDLNITSLSSGIYYLAVQIDDQVYTKSLIVE